jgi:hypothetical protein
MILKRYCGHSENVPDPETKKKWLMEKGRLCRKCRSGKSRIMGNAQTIENHRWWVPRPMAMAMDLYRE